MEADPEVELIGSSDDPYGDLERYIEKVHEEIGRVFDELEGTLKRQKKSVNGHASKSILNGTAAAPTDSSPLASDPTSADVQQKPCFRKPRTSSLIKSSRPEADVTGEELSGWTDNILAEFTSIVDSQLKELEGDVASGGYVTSGGCSHQRPRSRSVGAAASPWALSQLLALDKVATLTVKPPVESNSTHKGQGGHSSHSKEDSHQFKASCEPVVPLTESSTVVSPCVVNGHTGAVNGMGNNCASEKSHRCPPLTRQLDLNSELSGAKLTSFRRRDSNEELGNAFQARSSNSFPRTAVASERLRAQKYGDVIYFTPMVGRSRGSNRVMQCYLPPPPPSEPTTEPSISSSSSSAYLDASSRLLGGSSLLGLMPSDGEVESARKCECEVVEDTVVEDSAPFIDEDPACVVENGSVALGRTAHLSEESNGREVESRTSQTSDDEVWLSESGVSVIDATTQTSPTCSVSPSSSFTWVSSECGCDGSARTTSLSLRNSQERLSSSSSCKSAFTDVSDDAQRRGSSISLSESLENVDDLGAESGIGTGSPTSLPKRNAGGHVDDDTVQGVVRNGLQVDPKESWEKIRRRSSKSRKPQHQKRRTRDLEEVWVKREDVETQTKTPCDPPPAPPTEGVPVVRRRPRPLQLGPGAVCPGAGWWSNSPSPTKSPATMSLPSPSSVSLKLPPRPLPTEMGTKANSVPHIQPTSPSHDNHHNQANQQGPPPPTHRLSEIEAVEACKWLRAAGFPQYAQMYEDFQFPIDVSAVQQDHPFLDPDALQSLFRRLHALNRCAKMKLDTLPSKPVEESDEEEEPCALSENWTFQRHSRRWSRVAHGDDEFVIAARSHVSAGSSDSMPDSGQGAGRRDSTITGVHRIEILPLGEPLIIAPDEKEPSEKESSGGGSTSINFKRSGSERIKDGAKALLRRMESLKSRRKKKANREAIVISGPQIVDVATMQQRMKDLNCIDITPPTSHNASPEVSPKQKGQPSGAAFTEDSSTYVTASTSASEWSQQSTPLFAPRVSTTTVTTTTSTTLSTTTTTAKIPRQQLTVARREDAGAYSDSECSPTRRWLHADGDSDADFLRVVQEAGIFSLSAGPRLGRKPSNNPVEEEDEEDEDNAETKGKKKRSGSRHRPSVHVRAASITKEPSAHRRKSSSKTVLASTNESLLQPPPLHITRDDEEMEGAEDDDDDDDVEVDRKQKKGRRSYYDNVPVVICNRSFQEERRDSRDDEANQDDSDVNLSREDKSGSSDLTGDSSTGSSGSSGSTAQSDHEEVAYRQGPNVVRWHSFQRCSLQSRPSISRPPLPPTPTDFNSLSAGQMSVLRKLALLKLTAWMERYCPSHRSGWNWELPKFIRKIKAPDYKDRVVFGVPLLLILQRTGQALPKSIQQALRYLRQNAFDQVGLFRKSGVRSRIQKLRQKNEGLQDSSEGVDYEGQQAYDVADLVKQYFRELPEALLTNKLSETYIAIFQYLPAELRLEAVQCALLLLPDENREGLHTLLSFLGEVASASSVNQMTASNLAVCFAPSLFHVAAPRSSSASPRRRRTVGAPDQRDLSENKAAHECLQYLIREQRQLFSVPRDMASQCRFTYMEQSVPVSLEELGMGDWQGYMGACVQALLKEARERSRGWVSLTSPDPQVDIACKKVGDGHPLRLCRVATEVEAPPIELLGRVLRERHLWDRHLLKWRVAVRLAKQADVFQYVMASMGCQPTRDFSVLRVWRDDLPRGACVIVETSVEHPSAPLMPGGVRGIILASRFLIEPCGSGKSRILHLSRVDCKGRSPTWYNKCYGHICALYLSRIRDSFRHTTEGPESKV